MLDCRSCFCASLILFAAPVIRAWAEEPIALREAFAVGYRYHVSSRVELSGTLSAPAPAKPGEKPGPVRTLAVKGESAVEYDERVLELDAAGRVPRTLRIYERVDFNRKVGDQAQQSALRQGVRRLVLLRLKESEVPFSPDGPLTWGEIDLVRTDVFTPALVKLLPDKGMSVGDAWPAGLEAVQVLSDLDELKEGQVTCTLQEIAVQNGRRFARVGFKGTVTGLNEDGPNRQHLDGYFFFDLQSNHLSYLYLNGISWLLDKDGKAIGRVEGRYVLTRRLEPKPPALSDEAVRGVVTEPNDDNTQLLFDEPALGVRFMYPRRWTVLRADARQIALEEPAGSGLLITLEPATQTPTTPAFQKEIETWLRKQQAGVEKSLPARRVQSSPHEVECFGYEVLLDRQRLALEYGIVRQSTGGATLAGRLPVAEGEALRKDVERVARSLKLTPPKKE